jgi:hypothetical protein
MAAPTVPTGANGSAAGSTSSTITLPTTQADDILIWVWVNGGATGTPTFTTGTYNGGAFTSIDSGTWTTGAGGVRWSRCTGDHSGQTLIVSGATNSCASKLAVVRGCLTGATPVDTNISGASNAPATNTLAAFNTTVAETLVCLTAAIDDNQAVSSPTKNGVAMNALADAPSSGGTDSLAHFSSLDQTATGTTGSFAITVNAGTSEGKRLSAFALKPQPAAQTINAGVASESDTVPAATVIQPQLISGGVASESDTAPAATVSQPQAPVSGGVASEADSALAATVQQPQPPVSGGVASESDTAPVATVIQPQAPVSAGVESETDSVPAATVDQGGAGQTIAGGVASEADTAVGGTVTQPQAPIAGGIASEADSAPSGTVIQPQAPVSAGVAQETDTVPAATVDQEDGTQTILAGVAHETDTAPAGTVVGGSQPPVTNPPVGGTFDETVTGGVVVERKSGGYVLTIPRGGNIAVGPRGGTHDETASGGTHDQSSTGGVVH